MGARSSVHTAGPAPAVVVAARASGRLHRRPASNLMIITTAKPLHVRRRAAIHAPSCACLLITGQDNNMRFGQRATICLPPDYVKLVGSGRATAGSSMHWQPGERTDRIPPSEDVDEMAAAHL